MRAPSSPPPFNWLADLTGAECYYCFSPNKLARNNMPRLFSNHQNYDDSNGIDYSSIHRFFHLTLNIQQANFTKSIISSVTFFAICLSQPKMFLYHPVSPFRSLINILNTLRTTQTVATTITSASMQSSKINWKLMYQVSKHHVSGLFR